MPDLGGTLNAIATLVAISSSGQSQTIASGGGTFEFATALPDDNQRRVWIHNAGSNVVTAVIDIVGSTTPLTLIIPATQMIYFELPSSALDSAGSFEVTNAGASNAVVTVNTMSG